MVKLKLPVVLFCSIALLTFLAYLRSFGGPLIFDDVKYINSSHLKNIAEHLSLSFRSIAKLSFSVNYYLSGMDLAAFRITNVVLHIFTGGLVFYLTYSTLRLDSLRDTYRQLDDGRLPVHMALFAATIFLLHPIQTSAVNYITQRMAIMAAMFSFAGVILYVKGASLTGKNSLGPYALSAACFVLAIFSKENAVMVIPALMLYDYFFLSSFRWGTFRKRFVPIVVILTSLVVLIMFYLHGGSIILKIVTIFADPHQPMASYGWSGTHMHWTPVEHILTELRVLVRYLFLVFVPLPSYMVFDYSNAYPVSKDLFHPIATLFSLFFLVTIVSLAIRYRKKMPLIAFGIIWYLVTISLESFIGVGLDPYFEYRNYLPGYGLFLAMASLFLYKEKLSVGVRTEVIILLVALLLFALTFTRNGIWREGRLFWEDTVEKSPNNVRARVNLGVFYAEEGLTGKAIEQYQIALRLMPDSSAALENLGIAYLKKGWPDKAIAEYRAALELQPHNYSVHYNMGLAYFQKGEADKAIEEYRTALTINPGLAKAHVNLGIAYGSKELMDKAIEHFLTAIELNPDLAEAHNNLGIAYAKTGSIDKAIEQFEIAVELQPDYKNARNNLRYLQRRTVGN